MEASLLMGDIFISDEVTVGRFRASGFSVRECSSSLYAIAVR